VSNWDAIVIGGGFYGCEVALELRRAGFERVTIIEREPAILRRASFVNQARVHNGYHYPRSFATAVRSRYNFERFCAEYHEAIVQDFEKIYAIARGSRVSAAQFSAFCGAIGASCRLAPQRLRDLFDRDLIEDCFVTREFAFDSSRLAGKISRELLAAGVVLRLKSEAKVVDQDERGVKVCTNEGIEHTSWLFNCTYGELEGAGVALKTRIKKELTEMLLIDPPLPLAHVGVTVMDGPFFSTMPFPAAGLHSLSHVRYTPHEASEEVDYEPPRSLSSNREYMIRDAARYMPVLGGARVVQSLYEVKAVLSRSESDDGRPILVERSGSAPRIFSILGSKIDNIYDVREFLSRQIWC
jgi:glycine/D-amino acid oxidase-like deaminating enzyme